ncbi:uncharacterized protein [Amphiura filiformis]|uniref:uncharacterized protein n=1 Tax=Amphiura filiformis TaxID=82378 RepID=UPI003B211F2C
MAIEDEGRYYCKHGTTDELKYGIRTVEVRSTELKMTQDGSDTSTVVVTEDETSEIVCTAIGARPAVEIRWYHVTNGGSESRITAGVGSTEVDNGDGTFDTVGTLNYTASRNYNDGQLRCQTHGQQVAEFREHISTLNVRFPPDVTLIYGNDRATCTVESANSPVPTPGGFTFIVNNTNSDPYPPTSCEGNVCYMDLQVDFDTNLRCNVTNDVGTATATYLAEPGATPPTITTEGPSQYPGLGGVDLTLNISAVCVPEPPSNNVQVMIKVDGVEVQEDTVIALPSSGCLEIECTITKGSFVASTRRNVCTDVDSPSGVPVAAVAVPLAIIAAAAIAFAIIVFWRSQKMAKSSQHGSDPESGFRGGVQQSQTSGQATPRPYMELDPRTREQNPEAQSQLPDAQSSMYEAIGDDGNTKDGAYQQLGQPAQPPARDNSQAQAYVNVNQMQKGKRGKHR